MMATKEFIGSINYEGETQRLDAAYDTACDASYNTASNETFDTPGNPGKENLVFRMNIKMKDGENYEFLFANSSIACLNVCVIPAQVGGNTEDLLRIKFGSIYLFIAPMSSVERYALVPPPGAIGGQPC